MKRIFAGAIGSFFASITAPSLVFGQGMVLNVGTGTNIQFWELIRKIIVFLSAAILPIAIMLFIVGAFMVTISGIKEEYRQNGKNLIIGSMMSIAVVLGAYALLRTVDYFLTH